MLYDVGVNVDGEGMLHGVAISIVDVDIGGVVDAGV